MNLKEYRALEKKLDAEKEAMSNEGIQDEIKIADKKFSNIATLNAAWDTLGHNDRIALSGNCSIKDCDHLSSYKKMK